MVAAIGRKSCIDAKLAHVFVGAQAGKNLVNIRDILQLAELLKLMAKTVCTFSNADISDRDQARLIELSVQLEAIAAELAKLGGANLTDHLDGA